MQLTQQAGGAVRLIASYRRGTGYPATQFTWTWSDDGAEPPTPSHDLIDLAPETSPYVGMKNFDSDELVAVDTVLGAYPNGTTIKLKLAMTAGQLIVGNGVYDPSSVITELELVVDTAGPAGPAAGRLWTGRRPETT